VKDCRMCAVWNSILTVFYNPILFAISTSIFSKLCKKYFDTDVQISANDVMENVGTRTSLL
jgi:hypothetical protein